MSVRILTGDCRDMLTTLPDASVQAVVTSPPYYGLRNYGTATWEGGDPACEHTGSERYYSGKTAAVSSVGAFSEPGDANADRLRKGRWREDGVCTKCGASHRDLQIGLEQTPDAYVAEMVAVFREVRRVLRDDGTVWLNLGDSYAGYHGNKNHAVPTSSTNGWTSGYDENQRASPIGIGGIKPKDLLGIPWMVAFALRADGWWLRSDIIWVKPNPMPESVTDRPTSSHEHVFLLSKRDRYFYDADAIREQGVIPAGTLGAKGSAERYAEPGVNSRPPEYKVYDGERNARNVWTIATQPYAGTHFATMPPDLAERCIKAGTRPGDTVLDPFGGAGTTGLVADRLGRNSVLIELNPQYADLARERLRGDCPMFAEVA